MKKLKGNVTIKLFDKDGKLVHEESKDNMITNAIYYALGQCITNYGNPTDALFPLATKGLGGVWLFDGELEEDVENIHFPSNVHLVGHAGQSQNTSDIMRGSLNVSESGRTDTGYVNTWDFNTSQANGNIKAVALTSATCGDEPLYAWNGFDHDISNSSHTMQMFSCYYDKETQTLFGFRNNGLFYKHIPSYDLKVTDPRYDIDGGTVIQQIIEDLNTHNDYCSRFMYTFSPDLLNNGYLYAIVVNRKLVRDRIANVYYDRWHYGYDNAEGDAEVWIRKYKYVKDDQTFEEEPYSSDDPRYYYKLTNVHAKGAKINNSGYDYQRWAILSEGYLWLVHTDDFHVYRININDTSQIQLFGPFASETGINYNIGYIYPMKGGAIITSNNLVIYPDGHYIRKTNARIPFNNYIDENLFLCHAYPNRSGNHTGDYSSTQKGFPTQYLGSIMNLGQTITKTSATSMKIVYTLTDAEYEEDNG